MRIVDLIIKKRDGLELDDAELRAIIRGYSRNEIPDYQMAAWLMAVFFQGMSERETAGLTMAMAESGEIVDLNSVPGIKVDKHSTGGVADTTTLVLAPLVAAAGVPVAKMSGRGLGFTGGTIDKLDSIPGFRTALSRTEFLSTLVKHGVAITGQTPDIAPADGKIYALRDVTGTIESIPLIASSIMSKKIAAGADKIVLDVKAGSGAFMKKTEDAVKLAEAMVHIGECVGRETMAVISSMAEPLGQAIGNSLEVEEAIDILTGQGGAAELRHICLTLGGHMLVAAGVSTDFDKAYARLVQLLDSREALAKFVEMVVAQGGDPSIVNQRNLLPRAELQQAVASDRSGYVQKVDTARIGYSAMLLGAGREYKGQKIDLGAGLMMQCRIGDYVEKGQALATIYTNDTARVAAAVANIRQAISISLEAVVKPPLILGTVDKNGVHLV